MTAQDVVIVVNAFGNAWALTGMVVGLGIVAAVRASVRNDASRVEHEGYNRHLENMERLRLDATKEITAPKRNGSEGY